jgi:hypothetical protein
VPSTPPVASGLPTLQLRFFCVLPRLGYNPDIGAVLTCKGYNSDIGAVLTCKGYNQDIGAVLTCKGYNQGILWVLCLLVKDTTKI